MLFLILAALAPLFAGVLFIIAGLSPPRRDGDHISIILGLLVVSSVVCSLSYGIAARQRLDELTSVEVGR